ncbi:MAG TPA: hypothetical protein VHI52_07425, partial [Verrucomicrobiae bacterium]|nr:hypothetical protein [Verrucomicrobiae bacterium]
GAGALVANGYSAPSWITNAPGGVFQMAGDGELFSRLNGSYQTIFVNNGGLFTKIAGTNTLVDTCNFVNSSEVRADTGVLSFNALLQLNNGGTFTGAGTHRMIGGTMSVGGISTVIDSTLEIAAGQLQGAADNSGTFNTAGTGRVIWSGGSLLSGKVGVGTNSQMQISGSDTKLFLDGAVLENAGETVWSSGSLAANGYSGTSYIRNLPGARFVVSGTNTALRLNGSYFGRFENEQGGTLVIESTGESPWAAWQLVNDGTVQTVAGALRLDAGGASSGLFTNLTGGELRFGGGTFSLHEGTRFQGPGTARVTGATLTADGYAAAGAQGSAGLFALDSGTLNGTGFTSLGMFQWNGGNIGGTVSNAPGALFSIVGATQMIMSDGAIFNNAGIAQITNGRIYANGYSGASTWNNLPGARFEIGSDGGVFSRVNGSYQFIFNNSTGAWFGKTAGTNSVVDNCQFNNSGELSSSGSGTLAFSAVLNLNSGGVFTGSGRHQLLGGSAFWDGINTVQGTLLNLSGTSVTGSTNATLVTAGGGLFDWTGGTVAGTMSLSVGSRMQFEGDGPKVLADGAIFNNQGLARFLGAGLLTVNGYSADSLWNNLAGAHFEIANDGPVFGRFNGSHLLVFNNAAGAQLAKTAGTNSVLDLWMLNNTGELRSDSGTLAFNATVNLNSGGTFTGAGRH